MKSFFPVSRSGGFTLLEVMLVIFIVAMSAVAVVSALPTLTGDNAKTTAQSFYNRVQLLADEAMLSGRDFGFMINEAQETVVFLVLSGDGWQPVNLTTMKNQLVFKSGVQCDFSITGNGWKKDDDRLFDDDSDSMFDDESDSMFEDMGFGDKAKATYKPQVMLLSSGVVTQFSARFYSPDHPDSGWTVYVSSTGQIVLHGDGQPDENENGADNHANQ